MSNDPQLKMKKEKRVSQRNQAVLNTQLNKSAHKRMSVTGGEAAAASLNEDEESEKKSLRPTEGNLSMYRSSSSDSESEYESEEESHSHSSYSGSSNSTAIDDFLLGTASNP